MKEICELTNLCLVYHDDYYLLQKRIKKDWLGYALPGGHIEPGESIVDSVIREIKEETGLNIYHPVLCGVKQFPIKEGRYIVFLFKCNEYDGELIDSKEGSMSWVHKDELKDLDTVNDLEELIYMMLEDGMCEFQYLIEDNQYVMNIK